MSSSRNPRARVEAHAWIRLVFRDPEQSFLFSDLQRQVVQGGLGFSTPSLSAALQECLLSGFLVQDVRRGPYRLSDPRGRMIITGPPGPATPGPDSLVLVMERMQRTLDAICVKLGVEAPLV